MKIGIICASDTELEPFLPHIEDGTKSRSAMFDIYEGRVCSLRSVLLYSGVCKVNAAAAAQLLIDRYTVTHIINAGVAGVISPDVSVFDTVVAEKSVYHDVADDILTEFFPFMPSVYFNSDKSLLQAARCAAQRVPFPVRFGVIASGERFISGGRRDEIQKNFDPLAVDMETAAIAHICHLFDVPFISVRTISDTAGSDGAGLFEQNLVRASNRAAQFTIELMSALQKQHEK